MFNAHKTSFTCRVVNTSWYYLPASVVSLPNGAIFERRLDKYFKKLPVRVSYKVMFKK